MHAYTMYNKSVKRQYQVLFKVFHRVATVQAIKTIYANYTDINYKIHFANLKEKLW